MSYRHPLELSYSMSLTRGEQTTYLECLLIKVGIGIVTRKSEQVNYIVIFKKVNSFLCKFTKKSIDILFYRYILGTYSFLQPLPWQVKTKVKKVLTS